jgi:ABC-type phosphate transport system substrate-binding protein
MHPTISPDLQRMAILALPHRLAPLRARLAGVLAGVLAALVLSACSDDSSSPNSLQILDVTVALSQGVTCAEGGVDTEFQGLTGQNVTIEASGASNLRPVFTLYAPDFETQLGSSFSVGAGKARLIHRLEQPGTHHVTLCEENGAGGAVRVTVTAPLL